MSLADECTPGDTGSSSSSETTATTDPTTATGTTGPAPECGNSMVEPGEACDDGNDRNGDGCNNDCTESGQEVWGETFDPSASDRGHGGRLEDQPLAVGT